MVRPPARRVSASPVLHGSHRPATIALVTHPARRGALHLATVALAPLLAARALARPGAPATQEQLTVVTRSTAPMPQPPVCIAFPARTDPGYRLSGATRCGPAPSAPLAP